MKYLFFFAWMGLFIPIAAFSQGIPDPQTNIKYLVTFGPQADPSWGEDDHVQLIFFKVPLSYSGPIFLHVFDPDIGGKHDEIRFAENTQMQFSIYGGREAHSHPAARSHEPETGFDSGQKLDGRTFGKDSRYDDRWFCFKPVFPEQGEKVADGYIFKVIVQGLSGDDGNLYHFFLSATPNPGTDLEAELRPIPDLKAFAYEISFRSPLQEAFLYPYIEADDIRVQIWNFDFDLDGSLQLFSVKRPYTDLRKSGDGFWSHEMLPVREDEKEKFIGLRFSFLQGPNQDNNVVIYVLNQKGDALVFEITSLGDRTPIYTPDKLKAKEVKD